MINPFMPEMITINTLIFSATNLLRTILLLVAVAYYTAAERKIMGSIHRRRGPNVTGVWGLLQPIADGVKLVIKGLITPAQAVKHIFLSAPTLIFALSLTVWIVIPGYLSASETIWDHIIAFLSIWSVQQWTKSIAGMAFLYFFGMYSWYYIFCVGKFKTSQISPLLVLGLVVLDFALNMILGFAMVEFGHSGQGLYDLMHQCPIALSPFIFIAEMVWLYFYLLKTYSHDLKDEFKK